MADVEQTPSSNNVRKLRKKLRQIENLQRLCGLRELTDEETAKISRRDEIREELQDLLTMALDDDQQMSTPEIVDEKPSQDRGSENEGIKGDSEDDDEIAQEKHEAQEEEDSREAKIENGKSDGRGDRDVTMDTENASQESRKENEQLEVNETDDNKVKKVGRRKGSKRKGETAKQWDQLQFSVNLLEGHDHPLCSVDANEDIIVSAGHDTSLKIWSATSHEELFSLGGHTGSISAVLLISNEKAVTGSQDCSIRFWDVKKGSGLSSVYVYNPVTCLAYNGRGLLAVGNEGGKIDIYDVENESMVAGAGQSASMLDEAVVSLDFMDDGKLCCASASGVVKVFALEGGKLTPVTDTYDNITSVASLKKDSNAADTPNTSLMSLPLRKVNCMSSFNEIVFWGDDGYNVKAFETVSGKVVKLRNNLNEYSPTDALAVLKDGNSGYLFCAGFDIDTGSGYINVRKLPGMGYLGTITDSSLGHVSCISAWMVGGKIQIVTGGAELRIWSQGRNGKKRRASDELADVIPCKFVRAYNETVDSEDEESESETEAENEPLEVNSVEKKQEGKSWCVVQ